MNDVKLVGAILLLLVVCMLLFLLLSGGIVYVSSVVPRVELVFPATPTPLIIHLP